MNEVFSLIHSTNTSYTICQSLFLDTAFALVTNIWIIMTKYSELCKKHKESLGMPNIDRGRLLSSNLGMILGDVVKGTCGTLWHCEWETVFIKNHQKLVGLSKATLALFAFFTQEIAKIIW